MENSKIYDLLGQGLLDTWKKDIVKSESDTWFFADEREAFVELEKKLNPEERELLRVYSLALENKLDYIYYKLKIKVLNFGIKIGMELERSFVELER